MDRAPFSDHSRADGSAGSSAEAMLTAYSGATFGATSGLDDGAPPPARLGRKERMAARARMSAASGSTELDAFGTGAAALTHASHTPAAPSTHGHPNAEASSSRAGVRQIILAEVATGMNMGIEEEIEDELDSDDLLDEGLEVSPEARMPAAKDPPSKKGRLKAVLFRSKGKRKQEQGVAKAVATPLLPPLAADLHGTPPHLDRTASTASQHRHTPSHVRPPISILQKHDTPQGSPASRTAPAFARASHETPSRSPSVITHTPAGTYVGTTSSSDRLSRASSFTSFTGSPVPPMADDAVSGGAITPQLLSGHAGLGMSGVKHNPAGHPPGTLAAHPDLPTIPQASPPADSSSQPGPRGRVIDYGRAAAAPPALQSGVRYESLSGQAEPERQPAQDIPGVVPNQQQFATQQPLVCDHRHTDRSAAVEDVDGQRLRHGHEQHQSPRHEHKHTQEPLHSANSRTHSLRSGSQRRHLPPAPPPPAPEVALPPVPASTPAMEPRPAPPAALPSRTMTFVDPLDGKEYAIPPSMLAALLHKNIAVSQDPTASAPSSAKPSPRSSAVSARTSDSYADQPESLQATKTVLPVPFVALAPPLRSPGGTLLDLPATEVDSEASSLRQDASAITTPTPPAVPSHTSILSGKAIVLGTFPNTSEQSLALSISTTASASGASQREGRRERLRRLQVQLKTVDTARNVREDIRGLDISQYCGDAM